MISLCRQRHQSGSRVLDPRTTTWIFTSLRSLPLPLRQTKACSIDPA
jgi:hypothetical protein